MVELFNKLDNIETFTHENKLYYYKNFKRVSPWHDIEYLNEDGTINMICEIPRYTRKKYEIDIHDNYNPIVQDTIDGQPREYIYGDMLFNYGAIPQTWEDPKILCDETQKGGDDDPLDIIDIGDFQAEVGMVYKVKVICILALIDDEETDWKIIAINVNDRCCEHINDIRSANYYKPGCLKAIKRWFEHYKTVRGKEKNKFGFNGNYKDTKYALHVVNKCHEMWKIRQSKEIKSSL